MHGAPTTRTCRAARRRSADVHRARPRHRCAGSGVAVRHRSHGGAGADRRGAGATLRHGGRGARGAAFPARAAGRARRTGLRNWRPGELGRADGTRQNGKLRPARLSASRVDPRGDGERRPLGTANAQPSTRRRAVRARVWSRRGAHRPARRHRRVDRATRGRLRPRAADRFDGALRIFRNARSPIRRRRVESRVGARNARAAGESPSVQSTSTATKPERRASARTSGSAKVDAVVLQFAHETRMSQSVAKKQQGRFLRKSWSRPVRRGFDALERSARNRERWRFALGARAVSAASGVDGQPPGHERLKTVRENDGRNRFLLKLATQASIQRTSPDMSWRP